MVAIVIIGAGLLGLSVGLLLRALAMPNAAALERIEQIESYGFTGAPAATARRRAEPALRDFARSIGRWLIDRSPRISEAAVKRDLTRAGMYSTSPAVFTGYRLVSSAVFAVAFLGLTLASGKSAALVVVGTPAAAIVGFV